MYEKADQEYNKYHKSTYIVNKQAEKDLYLPDNRDVTHINPQKFGTDANIAEDCNFYKEQKDGKDKPNEHYKIFKQENFWDLFTEQQSYNKSKQWKEKNYNGKIYY